ncbi:cell division protein FtsE [Ligilactobacillus salitolerans]|uniref:Cell division protein FtsE n=1 Tax=Ligilactobacillus salitolerans TaxID=1808352 RepID=A0A401ITR5_9LACO|nr:ATP-binding cassette domain-containing protein [Ligilactobacillus salitolerans]GBG94914.1 cell division protein FtsE [Ligilactobacillus salitolerans]
MIELKNVTKKYGQVWGIKDLSVQIEEGEFVYLVGPSGAGKTTFFKLLAAQEQADSGSIRVGNIEVERLHREQIYKLRRQLGIVLQRDLFFPRLTVKENLETCLSALEVPQEKWGLRIEQALASVKMGQMTERLPAQLSVGQQKKVALARALLNQPPVVIADEPTANLDVKSAKEMMQIFFRINQAGTTVLMATHDSTMVNSLRHRTLEIQNSQLVRDDRQGGYSRFADEKDVYVW